MFLVCGLFTLLPGVDEDTGSVVLTLQAQVDVSLKVDEVFKNGLSDDVGNIFEFWVV